MRAGLRYCAFVVVVVWFLALVPFVQADLADSFETGDLSALPWVTYGGDLWVVQNSVSYDESWAASLAPQPGQTGWLRLSVCVGGENATLRGAWKVDGGLIDFLCLDVDGETAAAIVGASQPWTTFEVALSRGLHTIEFSYQQGGGGGSDTNTVWLDDFSIEGVVAPAPQAAFTVSPSSGPSPLTVNFTDLSRFPIYSWIWDFGDGTSSREQNPTHAYMAAGTYTVSLTVIGGGGTDTATHTNCVTVVEPSVAEFSGTPLSGAAPLTVAFEDASTGGVTGWSWDFGDGGTSTEQDPSHVYLEEGTYSVTLSATGPGGTDVESKASYVTVAFTDPRPTPGAAFAVFPQAVSASAVAMVAEEAASYQGVEYYFDETSGGDGGSDSGWQASPLYVDEGLTPGTTYLYRVKIRPAVSTTYESAWSEVAAATTLPREGFETGDLTALPWVAGADAPWVVQGGTVFGGSWAAASAEGLANDGTSTLSVTRETVAGTVRFRYAVSSEERSDFLSFYVDGVVQGEWSGDVPWAEFAVAVSEGEHTFTWEYAKDPMTAVGADRAYLDDVELPAQVAAVAPVVISGGGGGGCVVGSRASGAGALLAVLLPLLALWAGKRKG